MTIEDWRREIDTIDRQLVLFLNQRARLAAKLLATKTVTGAPIYDSERESIVLEHICRVNGGPFGDDALKKIFRRIITETRRVEIKHARSSHDSVLSQANKIDSKLAEGNGNDNQHECPGD